uniref:Uncharacterized protein n=1 Tax=Medicago truncatula TaxID=3880 RepID=I3T2Q0_MEDTR|nr:unknown [Medicago truncatula]
MSPLKNISEYNMDSQKKTLDFFRSMVQTKSYPLVIRR